MPPVTRTEPLRIKRRAVAWSLTACSSVFLLIGFSGLIVEPAGSPSFLFFVGLTLLSVVLVFRTFRMATILVKGDSLIIRGFLRTRHMPIETIRAIESIDEPYMYGMAGKTLAIRTFDGGRVVAGEFWSRVDSLGHAPRIDAITRELSRLRASPPGGLK